MCGYVSTYPRRTDPMRCGLGSQLIMMCLIPSVLGVTLKPTVSLSLSASKAVLASSRPCCVSPDCATASKAGITDPSCSSNDSFPCPDMASCDMHSVCIVCSHALRSCSRSARGCSGFSSKPSILMMTACASASVCLLRLCREHDTVVSARVSGDIVISQVRNKLRVGQQQ